MFHFLKTIGQARFPIRNKFTVGLGYALLILVLILILCYYLL